MPSIAYRFPVSFLWGTWYTPPPLSSFGLPAASAPRLASETMKTFVDTASEAGFRAVGLPLPWVWAWPQPEKVEEEALAFYQALVARAHRRGLQVWVSLSADPPPAWWEEMGGWQHPQAPERFAGFAARVVQALHPWVDGWWLVEDVAHPEDGPRRLDAYRKAAEVARRLTTAALVLGVVAPVIVTPARRCWPPDWWAVRRVRRIYHVWLRQALTGPYGGWVDGVFLRLRPPQVLRATGQPHSRAWEPMPPEGYARHGPVFRLLRRARAWRKPLLVLGATAEPPIIQAHLLVDHLLQLWHALNLGTVLRGFFYPGPGDPSHNTASALYRDVVASQGLTHEVVARHLPDRLPQLYPGLVHQEIEAMTKLNKYNHP